MTEINEHIFLQVLKKRSVILNTVGTARCIRYYKVGTMYRKVGTRYRKAGTRRYRKVGTRYRKVGTRYCKADTGYRKVGTRYRKVDNYTAMFFDITTSLVKTQDAKDITLFIFSL